MKKSIALIGVILMGFLSRMHATVWYVHPDSTLNAIQAGLDSCSTGDTVLVAPGTYYEHIVWPNTQGIDLISEFGPDLTIIDGYNGWGSIIQINASVDTTTIINGFTMQNGYNYSGGGILCENCSPVISGNTIIGNEAVALTYAIGGGISCYNSSPIIRDNVITYNYAASDYAEGGGIHCHYGSSPTITNNIINNNAANAMFASKGGGICCGLGSSPTITGNTIIGNGATLGGGIYMSSASSIIDSCTISNNYDDGIFISNSDAVIDSCTISNNIGDGVHCGYGGTMVINYCNIMGNTGFGVYNGVANVINAEYNWWGDSTGPYHPDSNPGGLGDSVSDYVDFVPWVTEPFPWGVEENTRSQKSETRLIVYPNPARRKLKIRFNSPVEQKVTIKLYDVTGRFIDEIFNGRTIIGTNEMPIMTANYAAGIYFISIETDKEIITEKFIMLK